MATPLLRWPKQTWIPVPVAEAQMTRPSTVRELLARQAARETPKESTPEASQPTALKSPPAREVSAMETERTGTHPHGHGNAGGTDSALEWSGNQ